MCEGNRAGMGGLEVMDTSLKQVMLVEPEQPADSRLSQPLK